MSTTLRSESPAANAMGSRRSIVASQADIAGPTRKPIPKAIPMTAKPCARFSGGVTSTMAAWATVRLPAVTPSSGRAREDHREGVRRAEHEEAREGAELREGEHGLAADAVGEVAEEGARHELAEREGRHEEPHVGRRRAEALGVEGQERDDQREGEDVDDDDEEDGNER